jgi:hypothetical protein
MVDGMVDDLRGGGSEVADRRQAWSMTSEVAEVADCQGGSTAPEVADRWVLLEQNRKKC